MKNEENTDRRPVRVGIDIGGTFTDFVTAEIEKGSIETFKILSTPEDPSQAVLAGLDRIVKTHPDSTLQIVHGSTVATNALLERKGAPTGIVTTQGFADLLQIGRQNRPDLYDFFTNPPEPLVPEQHRLEVLERISAEGEVLFPLQESELGKLEKILASLPIESVAICLLFSFLRPEHETMIAERLRSAGYFVSVSSEISPEYREFERLSTTVINAYVSPVLDRYLARLQERLSSIDRAHSLSIMQSNGGSISVKEAREFGVRCILSGPAGGVMASQYVGGKSLSTVSAGSLTKLITFDMGGTSTDVSLIDGTPKTTSEAAIGSLPIRIPVLNIHTIGAGGGSIASVDLGGALRVGPQSAGADPGPACYGRVDPRINPDDLKATVTDANLVLGRLDPKAFLGGEMPLHTQLAEQAISSVGEPLRLTPVETALGIIAVANAHMERALRVISVARGHDPREFALFSFGGAGGLHACELAARLGIPQVVVPPTASTLSALGMQSANTIKDYAQTVMVPAALSPAALDSRLLPMRKQGLNDLMGEGFRQESIQIESFLDMRYQGQSFELTIPFESGTDFIPAFHRAHQQAFGYQRPDVSAEQIEIVNLRVRATGTIMPPALPFYQFSGEDPGKAYLETRLAYLDSNQADETPFYQGELLQPGNQITGPAVITRPDTTILLTKNSFAQVDSYLNLVIQIQ